MERVSIWRVKSVHEVLTGLALPSPGRKHLEGQHLTQIAEREIKFLRNEDSVFGIVKQTDYAALLAAYESVKTGSDNRFNVLRRSIHQKFSDQFVLLTCLTLK